MKISIVALFVLVTLVASVYGYPSKGSTKAALNKKPSCYKDCGDVYKPICVGDGSGKENKSFGSECVLANYNCENKANWKLISQGECPGGGGVRLS
ncbi:uncharacterized protein LOC108911091 [Anoplophora glabripennis]|uniref:uncharacterized protein LOC108911091 n=1 Tax=Anoplophora glabripennis TaxID=217634 RepID=UPI000875492C|nr:uncharacterized protein LOC108911091 [Anoplophora glabripennis]